MDVIARDEWVSDGIVEVEINEEGRLVPVRLLKRSCVVGTACTKKFAVGEAIDKRSKLQLALPVEVGAPIADGDGAHEEAPVIGDAGELVWIAREERTEVIGADVFGAEPFVVAEEPGDLMFFLGEGRHA